MNQVFSFTRWWMLVNRHWIENRKRYLLALLAIAGLLVAWFGFVIAMNRQGGLLLLFQFAAYFVGLFFIGCLYASTMFAELSSKPEGINYLAVPASHLEKLCCAVFFGVFLFFVAYTLIFYIVDIPMVNLSLRLVARHPSAFSDLGDPQDSISIFNIITGAGGPIRDLEGIVFLVWYFAIQSAFILGSVYFTKYSFLKTVVAILLFLLLFVFFIERGIHRQLPEGWHLTEFFLRWSQLSSTKGEMQMVRLPGWIEQMVMLALPFGIPILFWVVTYFRLKEKEV